MTFLQLLMPHLILLKFEKLSKVVNFGNFVDGTTNFAHSYPSFAVSVGVLFRGKPAAAAVVINLIK